MNESGNDIEFETKSGKKSIFGVLFILIAVAGFVFLARPLARETSAVKADVLSKQTEIEVLQTQLEDLKKAEKDLELSTEVQRLESLKAIPTDMNQDEVIRDLIEIADTYDIELSSISFGRGTGEKEEIGVLQVNAGFEGNYLDLIDFLEGLEQNARLFKVNTISVQVSELSVGNIKRANFNLTIETYFQK